MSFCVLCERPFNLFSLTLDSLPHSISTIVRSQLTFGIPQLSLSVVLLVAFPPPFFISLSPLTYRSDQCGISVMSSGTYLKPGQAK